MANHRAVRFDIPSSWVMKPGDDTIRFTNREPPDEDCLLQFSVMCLNAEIDCCQLPLRQVVEDMTTPAKHDHLTKGPIHEETRSASEMAWLAGTVRDPRGHREAYSRLCHARGRLVKQVVIQPLITVDFWPEHYDKFSPVWDEVLRSLALNDWIKDSSGRILC